MNGHRPDIIIIDESVHFYIANGDEWQEIGTTTEGVHFTPMESNVKSDVYELKRRLRRAAFIATRLYPGALGDYLSRELLGLEEHSWLFENVTASSPIHRLVEEILKEDQNVRQA